MISINKAEAYHHCNCCGGQNEPIIITFRLANGNATNVTLCERCAMALTDLLIERYGIGA